MKKLIVATAFILMSTSFVTIANANNAGKDKCKGVAARATPPVVNYPTHIRNVVWRNVRAMCLQQSSTVPKSSAKVN